MNPIQNLVVALTNINPQEFLETGIEGIDNKLDEAFIRFEEYVWGRFHYGPDEIPFSGDEALAFDELVCVDEIVNDACENLNAIGFHDVERLDVFNNYYDSINRLKSELSQYPSEIAERIAKEIYSAQQDYALRMSMLVDNLIGILQTDNGMSHIVSLPDFFLRISKMASQISDAYNYLIDNEWIEDNLDEDEFLYYFGGKGKVPQSKIHWIEAKNYLAMFVAAVSDDDHKWDKASKIFEIWDERKRMFVPVTNTLRNNFNSAINIKDKEKLRKNKELIENIFS